MARSRSSRAKVWMWLEPPGDILRGSLFVTPSGRRRGKVVEELRGNLEDVLYHSFGLWPEDIEEADGPIMVEVPARKLAEWFDW